MTEMDASWIVVDYDHQPATIVCKRCNERTPFPFGQIKTVLAMLAAFAGVHCLCQESNGGKGEN